MSGAPCRVCGRELDDCGTCVCATWPAAPPPPALWSWVTKEETDALRAALHALLDHGADVGSAVRLADLVEQLLVELPRRRLPADSAKEEIALFLRGARSARGDDAPMRPLGEPPCVCECGAQFVFVEGETESRSCCYFCSQRERRERQAADGDRARNEGEEALRNRGETKG